MRTFITLLFACWTITSFGQVAGDYRWSRISPTGPPTTAYVEWAGKNVIYVSKGDGATDTRTGLSPFDATRPFATIGAAVTAATAGNLIVVGSGTYTENVTAKNGVNMRIDGKITSATGWPGATLTMGAGVAATIEGSGSVINTSDGMGVILTGSGTKKFSLGYVEAHVGLATGRVSCIVDIEEIYSDDYDALIVEPGTKGAIRVGISQGTDNGIEFADNSITPIGSDEQIDLTVYGDFYAVPMPETYPNNGAVNLSVQATATDRITIIGAAKGFNAPAITNTGTLSGVTIIGTATSDTQEAIKDGNFTFYGSVDPADYPLARVSGAGTTGLNRDYYYALGLEGFGVIEKRFVSLGDGGIPCTIDKLVADGSWHIYYTDGVIEEAYASTEDVDWPWQVVTWTAVNGANPVPTVTEVAITPVAAGTKGAFSVDGTAYVVSGSDKNITLTTSGTGLVKSGTNPVLVSTLTTNAPETANSVWAESDNIVFEGSVADENEVRIQVTNPNADRTYIFSGATGGTVAVTNASQTLTQTQTFSGVLSVTGTLQMTGTTAPSDTTTPDVWVNMVVGGTSYRVPGYLP